MMKVLGMALAMLMSTSAMAEFTGNIGVTNDYVFRGESQSNEDMAFQGGVDWTVDDRWYLGAWASSVDFQDGDEASVELDVYGGYVWDMKQGTTFDVGGIYYAYPGANSSLDYDFYEIYGGGDHNFGGTYNPTIGGKVSYSPSYFGDQGDTFYYELTGSADIVYGFGLNASWGYLDFGDSKKQPRNSYTDYKVGLTKSIVENLDAELAYTGRNDSSSLTSDRWMASIAYTFD